MRTLASFLVVIAIYAGTSTAKSESASGVLFPQLTSIIYGADFVSPAANGIAMNDSGDVIGTSYPDTGCGSFCLPPLETVVWRNGQRIVLPQVPGFSEITVRSINNAGWVAGFAGFPNTATHAAVWKPNGDTYTAIDLGTLPGTNRSEAIGIDNFNRVVGWSVTTNFPPQGSPFMWTESGGLVDLSVQGFPDETPLAISPGGKVASPGFWYQLENPASVVAMAAPPSGFFPPGTYPTAINDAGDQARFLVSTGTQNPAYLFRFHHEGTWQQISFQGNFTSSIYGVGSIDAGQTISATVVGNAQIAYGPDETTQPLESLLSAAYQASSITRGGPINAGGQILAHVLIGNSSRVLRLTPTEPCIAGCIQVSGIRMKGRFVQDPSDPGHCSPTNEAHNEVQTKLRVTSETGAPLSGCQVNGRFLDDYWTNTPVSAVTNSQGQVTFKVTGPCGVGAVAFFLESVTKGARTLDKTAGTLSASVIPQ